MLGEENYLGAIILYAVVGALSLAGMVVYRGILKRRERKKSKGQREVE